MTVDSESFLALCKELRKLGACTVEGWGFKASFLPVAAGRPPTVDPARAHPARARADEPTAEQLREAQYARELGAL